VDPSYDKSAWRIWEKAVLVQTSKEHILSLSVSLSLPKYLSPFKSENAFLKAIQKVAR
jgi:hypothetical protein